MNNNSKNAYEIRLEILRMAHDDALSKYHHKIGVARDSAKENKTQFDDTLIDSLFPNTNSITSRAEELYKFVESK
jgi:hypothetical protein